MILKLIRFTLLVSLLCPLTLLAQEYTIEGLVIERTTGQAIELANVVLYVEGDSIYRGAITDINGLYQISSIEPGTYIFKVSYVGYQVHEEKLVLTGGNTEIQMNIELERPDETQGELTVTYSDRNADLDAGQRKITGLDLARVPTPAGGGDIASFLKTLPGVVSTGDRGGQLFVRGGTPSENMVLVDGLLIYQPFHIIGFFSAIPQDLIATADFYAGGFSPRYSGRTSSVLDVKLRRGNQYEYGGSAAISPFITELFVEGPWVKGKSSVVFSTRRSIVEESGNYLPVTNQPLHFDSQFLKVSYNSDIGGSCSGMFMRTYDRGRMDFDHGDSFMWNNLVFGGKCSGLSDGAISLFDVSAGFSHIGNDAFTEAGENMRTSNATLFSLNVNLTQFLKEIKLDYGFSMNVNAMDYDINELFVLQQRGSDSVYELGTYIVTVLPFGEKFNFQPGVAINFANTYNPSVEPRVRLSWQPRNIDNEEINAAFGIFRQTVTGITDNRDAGSAFTAWMPVPGNADIMQATHALLGWRQPIGENFNFSVEGYYKKLKNRPVAIWGTIAQFKTELTKAEGLVYGSDLNLNYYGRKLFLSLGYGYSWTEYKISQTLFTTWFGAEVQEYHPSHDRRHKLNMLASLDIKKLRLNASWQIGSGLPYTRPLGFDDLIKFEDKLPNIKLEPGIPRIILDRPYNGRLPVYHRLDISLERSFDFKAGELEAQIGAINTYNQENIFYFDVYTQRQINQLPFYPYGSLKLNIN